MSLQDFEFGKDLGKGAFGSVHIVKRKEDGKTYAMKRVKIAQLSQKERENALNEIRLLASFSHQNIIGYKEAFFDEMSKTINIVMELADDGDIQSKIKENTKSRLSFKESTIWSILIQVLQGMKYLHDNNIMHRDLKSANLFLMKSGTVKIGDLNVSKIAKMGMAYTQTGTPYYASPEVWMDKPYDYKSDIWSIGCIVYEMCTLKPPFRGTSLPSLFQNIKKGKYDPIPSIYSNNLSKILALMLQVNPASRLTSEELLKTEILMDKMKETQSIDMNDKIDSKIDLIKTIKVPRNMKEINRQLPVKRYKQHQEDMMANDEFETKKADFFKEINMMNHNNNNLINKIEAKENIRVPLPKKPQANNHLIKPNGLENKNKEMSNDEKKRLQRANEFMQKEKEKEELRKKNNKNNHVIANPRPASGVNNKPVVLKHNILNNNNIKKTPSNSSHQPKSNIIIVNNSNNKVNYRPNSGKVINRPSQVLNHPKISGSDKKGLPVKVKPSSRPIISHQPVPKKKVIIEKINYQPKNKYGQPTKPQSAVANNRKIVLSKVPNKQPGKK